MVEIVPGISGKAIRIGIERGLLQLWIVADMQTKKGGQLILVPLREFANGASDREYQGESWNGDARTMRVSTNGNTITLRQYTPSGTMLGSISVDSHRFHSALAKFVPGISTRPSNENRSIEVSPSANMSKIARPDLPANQTTKSELPTLTPEWFWKMFRQELRSSCTESALDSSRSWTKVVIAAAVRVCEQLSQGVIVQQERPMRLDVSARLPNDDCLAIAFESELAPVGYMGRTHEKTWREEFVKLCGIPAQLRVLSSYFLPGTGSTFEDFLRRQLNELSVYFQNSAPGKWLLVFGSENSTRDPDQPWLAFSLDQNYVLRRVDDEGELFCPRRIARGLEYA